jgi:hypothetical protein
MHVDTHVEFGYELALVIPYAYYLWSKGLLESSTSCAFTKELYYFSKSHKDKYNARIFSSPDTPNRNLHVKELNYDQWKPPPYKDIYKNNLYVFDKPLLIVHNKYNTEWGKSPINFLSIETLERIFSKYNNTYQIIYIRPKSSHITEDNSKIYNLNEGPLLQQYNVIDANKLYEDTKKLKKINNFNHFQLLIHSNCNKFISVQGGNCILASFFGGTNIIYAKMGGELQCCSYEGWYKRFSNCNVKHADNVDDFFKLIECHL